MRKIIILLILCLIAIPVHAGKMYWANALSGGGDGIDGIDGDLLSAGDGCFVVLDSGTNEPKVYVYRLQTSSATESSPNVITPDSNAGTKRWHLAGVISANLTIQDVTDNNYLKITNNSSRAATAAVNEIYPEGNVWKINSNGTETYMGHFVAVPTTASDACSLGQFSGDASWIYVCYQTNTWRRSSAATW